MKKTLLAIILGGGVLVATNASASNSGTINFSGKVTSATCNIAPEVNGASVTSIVLGTATLTSEPTAVNFKLKPAAGSTDCLSKRKAQVEWSGSMNGSGYNNTATGASAANGFYMTLRATNSGSGSAGANINSSFTRVDYNHNAGIASFDYTAQLRKSNSTPTNGGYKAGLFTTAASFSVTYM
ncbi:fimbrial protein [Salmonella enterica subsp. diarizonae]|nr:fimbrial protein [Salmonella enterica subsp. diarizonae]EDV3465792.1 fimbrial protein [Salmonella enterica subsp. diarizonae]